MIVLVGLVVLIVAVLVAVAGVMTNSGGGHPVGGAFTVFGQHLTGLSTGQLFLYGVVVGVAGMLGLSILTGAFTRRLASSGARRELRGSRRETTAARADSDRLARQLDDEHATRAEAETSTPASPQPSPRPTPQPSPLPTPRPTPLPASPPPLPTGPGGTTAQPDQPPAPATVPATVPAERSSVRQRMFHHTGR
jgi:hypothetical protein